MWIMIGTTVVLTALAVRAERRHEMEFRRIMQEDRERGWRLQQEAYEASRKEYF